MFLDFRSLSLECEHTRSVNKNLLRYFWSGKVLNSCEIETQKLFGGNSLYKVDSQSIKTEYERATNTF